MTRKIQRNIWIFAQKKKIKKKYIFLHIFSPLCNYCFLGLCDCISWNTKLSLAPDTKHCKSQRNWRPQRNQSKIPGTWTLIIKIGTSFFYFQFFFNLSLNFFSLMRGGKRDERKKQIIVTTSKTTICFLSKSDWMRNAKFFSWSSEGYFEGLWPFTTVGLCLIVPFFFFEVWKETSKAVKNKQALKLYWKHFTMIYLTHCGKSAFIKKKKKKLKLKNGEMIIFILRFHIYKS